MTGHVSEIGVLMQRIADRSAALFSDSLRDISVSDDLTHGHGTHYIVYGLVEFRYIHFYSPFSAVTTNPPELSPETVYAAFFGTGTESPET